MNDVERNNRATLVLASAVTELEDLEQYLADRADVLADVSEIEPARAKLRELTATFNAVVAKLVEATSGGA